MRANAVLADHHFKHGRYAATEPLYRRLMALREQGKIDENWDSSLANWAHLLAATGRAAEAAQVKARIASSSPEAPASRPPQ